MGAIVIFIGLGVLCWAAFDVLVYALPIGVGIAAGLAAYHSGAGMLGAPVAGFIIGAFTLGFGQGVIGTSQSPVIRTIIALLFALPAAWFGYQATLGLTQLGGIPSIVWQQVFAMLGALVVGTTAWVRVTYPNPPDSEW
jgi:hypothetical protein